MGNNCSNCMCGTENSNNSYAVGLNQTQLTENVSHFI